MVRKFIIGFVKKMGGYISKLLLVKPMYQLYNVLYEYSPSFITHIAGKYIALPNKNSNWKIILKNGKQVNTTIVENNDKTRQFAVSYKWHSPELNFTEYLLNKYFTKDVPWIDIGSNLGMRSLLPLSEGRPVFFVEPNKELNLINKDRCLLNKFSNYTFFEVGASDKSGYSSFFIDTTSYNSTLNNQLLATTEIEKEEIIKIETIDSLFLDLLSDSETACIKIDVEGHELQVLDGAKNFIDKFTPTMIVEVNSTSDNFLAFNQLTSSYDYELFAIESTKRGKYFKRINNRNNQLKSYEASNDFLITKDKGLIKQIEQYVY